jgi:hypothetical protein
MVVLKHNKSPEMYVNNRRFEPTPLIREFGRLLVEHKPHLSGHVKSTAEHPPA